MSLLPQSLAQDLQALRSTASGLYASTCRGRGSLRCLCTQSRWDRSTVTGQDRYNKTARKLGWTHDGKDLTQLGPEWERESERSRWDSIKFEMLAIRKEKKSKEQDSAEAAASKYLTLQALTVTPAGEKVIFPVRGCSACPALSLGKR